MSVGNPAFERGLSWLTPPTAPRNANPKDAVTENDPSGDVRAAAVVLAAGSGTRLGAAQNKVFLPLAGRPVVA